jgi:hypothetical protein
VDTRSARAGATGEGGTGGLGAFGARPRAGIERTKAKFCP